MRLNRVKKEKIGPVVQRMSVTTGDAGRLIGMSGRMVRRLVAKGDLPASLIGRRWFIRIHNLEQLLDDRRVEKRGKNAHLHGREGSEAE